MGWTKAVKFGGIQIALLKLGACGGNQMPLRSLLQIALNFSPRHGKHPEDSDTQPASTSCACPKTRRCAHG
jgi:hypothetical protein